MSRTVVKWKIFLPRPGKRFVFISEIGVLIKQIPEAFLFSIEQLQSEALLHSPYFSALNIPDICLCK